MSARKAKADVLAYAAKVNRGGSRLAIWEAEIFDLLALSVSYRNIQAFLAERGTEADVSAIHRFVHAKKRARLLAEVAHRIDASSHTVAGETSAGVKPKPKSAKPAPPPAPPPDPPAAPKPATVSASQSIPASPANASGTIPKFQWKPDKYDIEDLK